MNIKNVSWVNRRIKKAAYTMDPTRRDAKFEYYFGQHNIRIRIKN